jgi:putative transposase
MSNTYTQIHIQCIAAVKYRAALIDKKWKERLHQYITAILQERGHKMIAINSVPDHLHFFFGCRPTQSLSDLMEIVKGESSEWVNKQRLCRSKFRWQGGYGAFSYDKSQIPIIANYIHNQEEHHRKRTFLEEYEDLLKQFGIDYDSRYIFKPPE